MRSTQIFGLTENAENFLTKNVKRWSENICHHCDRFDSKSAKRVYDPKTGKRKGMFDDGPPLYEYIIEDGRIIQEVVQAVPWSSGPCIFLCLQEVLYDKVEGYWYPVGNRLFEWTQPEINSC